MEALLNVALLELNLCRFESALDAYMRVFECMAREEEEAGSK